MKYNLIRIFFLILPITLLLSQCSTQKLLIPISIPKCEVGLILGYTEFKIPRPDAVVSCKYSSPDLNFHLSLKDRRGFILIGELNGKPFNKELTFLLDFIKANEELEGLSLIKIKNSLNFFGGELYYRIVSLPEK